jgi:hypothetical protein
MKRCYCLLLIAATSVIACHQKRIDPNSSSTTSSGPALTIHPIESPSGVDSREPELTTTPDGRVILSWVEKVNDHYSLRYAIRTSEGWSEPLTVSEGWNWFVNWADFPSVIALTDGSLAAHWLVKSGSGTYAYDVNIALSKDGKTWAKPVVPHTDNTPTEHGFVSLVPLSNGRLGAIWLDGRHLKDVKEKHDEQAPLPVSMTLRYATIDAHGNLSEETELDQRVCECCQTSAALTSEGIIAVYRDRSDQEVRDIYSVKGQQQSWSSPKPVHSDNWRINGCPVNGPSVSARDRNVVVAWYTGVNNSPRVKVAFSNDAGASFGPPIDVDEGDAQGRVDVVLLSDGSALVSWLGGSAERGAIKARRIKPDGLRNTPAVVATSDIARSSGFPRMAILGNDVYFAWTEFGKPSYVRTAKADISAYK